MGMEVNGVAALSSYQSQNSQVAKPVSHVSSVTTTTDKSNEVVVDSAKSATSICGSFCRTGKTVRRIGRRLKTMTRLRSRLNQWLMLRI